MCYTNNKSLNMFLQMSLIIVRKQQSPENLHIEVY